MMYDNSRRNWTNHRNHSHNTSLAIKNNTTAIHNFKPQIGSLSEFIDNKYQNRPLLINK